MKHTYIVKSVETFVFVNGGEVHEKVQFCESPASLYDNEITLVFTRNDAAPVYRVGDRVVLDFTVAPESREHAAQE